MEFDRSLFTIMPMSAQITKIALKNVWTFSVNVDRLGKKLFVVIESQFFVCIKNHPNLSNLKNINLWDHLAV